MEQSTRSQIVKMILETRKEFLVNEKNYEFAKEYYIKYLATISAYRMIEEITEEESIAMETEAAQILARLENGLPRYVHL